MTNQRPVRRWVPWFMAVAVALYAAGMVVVVSLTHSWLVFFVYAVALAALLVNLGIAITKSRRSPG